MAYNPYRMNRIFPGELTAPDLPEELNIHQLMDVVNPIIDQDHRRNRKEFEADREYNRTTGLQDLATRMQWSQNGGPQTGGPNTMNPFRRQTPTGIGEKGINPAVSQQMMSQPQSAPQQSQAPRPARQNSNLYGYPNDPDRFKPYADMSRPIPDGLVNGLTASERAGNDLKTKELESRERMANIKVNTNAENNQQKNEIAQQRADIYGFKAQNPGMKFQISKGGNIIALDPITGQGQDTGISSGTLSDADKIAITNTGDLAEIKARGEVQQGLQNTRGNQALGQIAARVAGQKDIQNTRGTQALEQIGARTSGQKDIQNTRGTQALEQIRAKDNEVVVEKDGKRFKLPKHQVADALAQGYKVVK